MASRHMPSPDQRMPKDITPHSHEESSSLAKSIAAALVYFVSQDASPPHPSFFKPPRTQRIAQQERDRARATDSKVGDKDDTR
eukprot:3940665-Rhodomonas_salina.4